MGSRIRVCNGSVSGTEKQEYLPTLDLPSSRSSLCEGEETFVEVAPLGRVPDPLGRPSGPG